MHWNYVRTRINAALQNAACLELVFISAWHEATEVSHCHMKNKNETLNTARFLEGESVILTVISTDGNGSNSYNQDANMTT